MSSKPIWGRSLLEAKALTAHYAKVKALDNISLYVGEGMVVSLIGANGAGKSTTFKVISGLIKPSDGGVWFQGDRVDGLPPHEITKRGIAHVPEGRRLFTKMTVSENLQMGGYTRKTDKKSDDARERGFHHFPVLKERLNQKAGTLSGGEQQMLAIARGLMAEPKLMILDEPSIGLSPIVTAEIGRVISEINKEGITVLLAEQNARLAIRLSNYVYAFETGRIVLEGTPEELSGNEEVIKAYLSA